LNSLIKYDAAISALAACAKVDEVKDWVDMSAAYAAYARQAKDKEMRKMAIDIRMRAKRRLGELMAEHQVTAGKNKGGRAKRTGLKNNPVSLAEAGIDKNLAHESRTAAALTPAEFEAEVADRKAEVDRPDIRKRENAKLADVAENPEADDEPGEAPADYSEADHEEEMRAADAASFAAMSAIIDADDKLGAAIEEIKAEKQRYRQLEGLYAASAGEFAAMKREASRWMRKAKKSTACQNCMTALERE